MLVSSLLALCLPTVLLVTTLGRGAARVLGLEMTPQLAAMAQGVVRRHGVQDRVRILPIHSSELERAPSGQEEEHAIASALAKDVVASAVVWALNEAAEESDAEADGNGDATGSEQPSHGSDWARGGGDVGDVGDVGGVGGGASHATKLARWMDDRWERRADLLVFEILGTDPLCEGLLPALQDARERLLTPDARVVPCMVEVRVRGRRWLPKYGKFEGPLLSDRAEMAPQIWQVKGFPSDGTVVASRFGRCMRCSWRARRWHS